MPSSAGTRPPAPGTQSPFGWTGVRRQRYTRWNGNLDGRQRIVLRMIKEGVRFNVKTWPVIILLALGWMVTVFFPVMFASMGGLPLEADNPGTWDPNQGVNIAMHSMVAPGAIVEYPLRGGTFTNQTNFMVLNLPSGWSAFFNRSFDGDNATASLMVRPDEPFPPNSFANIQAVAQTGRRTDSYNTFTTIALDNLTASIRRSYDMLLTGDIFEGRAGNIVGVRFNITNTGTLPDGYNVTVTPFSSDWGISAHVNGARVPLRTCATVSQSGSGPFGSEGQLKIKYFQLDLSPGTTAVCEVRFATARDSARLNQVNLAIDSQQDRFIGGSYYTLVTLTDNQKVDLTGDILYGQIVSLQVFFALLLAAVVGSRMISTDLWEKSYNLYFARPMTKTDYIVGKFGTVGVILGSATIVPSIVTFSSLLLLSNISSTYVIDHIWVWGAIIGQGLVVVITFSTLSLAFSSFTARRFYAAAAMVVIYLVTAIMGQIVTGAFESKYGRLIGISDNFDVVGRTAFGIADKLDLGFPWTYSLAVLAALWVVCTFLVWYKVERTELSE